MSDVAFHVKVGVSGVNNGGVVLSCTETGFFSKTSEIPLVNSFIPSGVLFSRYDNRFDEHYGGGPS
jgi:hypothetical protein